mgnify:CR=1 FL=1
MYLKNGCEEEYAKRHAAIWPELVKMIKDQGVSDYSIFWDKDTNLLFAVQKCDKDTNSQDTSNVDPITQKWWDMMADIMEVNPDNSPVSIPLQELFHLDWLARCIQLNRPDISRFPTIFLFLSKFV